MGEMESSVDASGRALRAISRADNPGLDGSDRSRLGEEALQVEYFHRTLVSTLNALRFLIIRDQMDWKKDPDARTQLKLVAERELENSIRARSILKEAPWLDLSLRADGGFPSSQVMLEEKIQMIEKCISELDHGDCSSC